MKYLDVNGARFLAEKLASISSLQAGVPSASRLPMGAAWEQGGEGVLKGQALAQQE